MIIKACAVALTAAILGLILRELGFCGARLVSICATCAVMLFVILRLGEVQGELNELQKIAGTGGVVKDIMKIVGVGYLFGICADICLDLGEPTLSRGLLIAGKIEVVILTIPTLKEIIKMATDILK